MGLAVPAGKFVVRSRAGRLEIVIPAPCNILAAIFLGAWLYAWYFSERWAVQALLHGQESSASLLPILWFVGWTVGGMWTIIVWLWLFAGREVVKLTPGTLSLRSDVLRIGVTREYRIEDVRNLRAVTVGDYSAWGWSVLPRGDDGLAFDYRAQTVHFGTWLDEPEASQIIDELRAFLELSAAS
jgi:hypothetical protein